MDFTEEKLKLQEEFKPEPTEPLACICIIIWIDLLVIMVHY